MQPENDLDLRRRLRGLAGGRPPPVDLWPALAARLPARRSSSGRRPPWPWALAAALVMALATVWLLPGSQEPVVGSAGVVHENPMPAAAPVAVDEADILLAAYSQILVFEAEQAPQQWQWQLARPGARERMAASRELDASLRELAAALRIEPQSQLLRRLLHQTLSQRIALSRDVWTA